MKLKFDNISLQCFNSFKLVEKKRKPRNISSFKRLSKLVRGLCIKENDEYKIMINIKGLKPNIVDDTNPDLLYLDFTEDSYELKGVISVFSRQPDSHGKYTRFIRDEAKSRFSPGNTDVLVPFCHNWVCSGYIVKKDDKLMFEFHDCLHPKLYDVSELENMI